MSLRVVFAPEAEHQLGELNDYIASRAATDIAGRYVERVVVRHELLHDEPRYWLTG